MNKFDSYLDFVQRLILIITIFLFPLFFLPITQEFYSTNKMYFLGFATILLLTLSAVRLISQKKLVWRKSPFDAGVFLLLLTVVLSVVISSPNKVEAILNPSFGLLIFLSLTLLFLFYSQANFKKDSISHILPILNYSALLVSAISLIAYFQPFKNLVLPSSLAFLKIATFSTIGSRVELAIFLGFVLITNAILIFKLKKGRAGVLSLISIFVQTLAFALVLYTIFKPSLQDPFLYLIPPYRLSWYAAVEILKNPLTAMFGVGVDNFASIFSRVKDLAYNQTNLWQISSFNLGRSSLLHLISTLGLFGLVAFGLLIMALLQQILKHQGQEKTVGLVGAALAVFIFVVFPPSAVLLFLFFIVLILNEKSDKNFNEIDLSHIAFAYWGLALLILAFTLSSFYLLTRAYAAEYYFKKSLDALSQRKGLDLYNNQRQAIRSNPYIERFRVNFSRTNLLLANNIILNARSEQKEAQLTDQQRQQVAQFIQQAISEAKSAVVLNSQKASSWENLATIYRNILNLAQDADSWTISSYQRAIVLDPNNPIYRLNLGGVYYSLTNYNQATSLFEQAAILKSDWPNAHYNLAWASYQEQDYQRAASEMQAVLNLLDKNKNPEDYARAEKELNEFKEKVASEKESTGAGQLQLPQTPQPQLSPKIDLPQNAEPPAASPEAR